MADIGYTFDPSEARRRLNSLNNSNNGQISPAAQQAVRILSLRLPTILGGRPPAPDDLLMPKPGGAAPSSAVLDSIRNATGAPNLTAGSGTGEASQLANVASAALSGSSPTPTFTLSQGGSGNGIVSANPVGTRQVSDFASDPAGALWGKMAALLRVA